MHFFKRKQRDTNNHDLAKKALNYVDRETGQDVQLSGDEAELAYFGKKQKLNRIFGRASMVGFVCIVMVTWQAMVLLLGGGLLNGGPLGVFCNFIYSWVGVMAMTLVMAEMGSMIPLSGGQYNWVALLAPKSSSKFLSYMTGWMTVIGWQALLASGSYFYATIIEGLVFLNAPTFAPKPWQTLLMAYAMICIGLVTNTLLIRILPMLEIIVLVVYLVGFVAILATLLAAVPSYQPASFVFDTFVDGGGWGSQGVSFLVGTTTTLFALIGNDGAAHMAEELDNPSIMIPFTMITSVIINGVTGLAIVIALLFCIGDLNSTLHYPSYPFFKIFRHVTGSDGRASAMMIPFLISFMTNYITVFTTASRMLWAFARERGVPGHRYISQVHTSSALPLWSLLCCVVINVLVTLLIFSPAAFNALTGITVAAFYSIFLLAATVMLHRRLTSPYDSIRWGPFTLGRFAIPVYVFSIAFAFLSWFFSFWPAFKNPGVAEMNWSVVVYCGFVFLALVYWVLWARHTYTGPIVEIDIVQDRDGKEGKSESVGEVLEIR